MGPGRRPARAMRHTDPMEFKFSVCMHGGVVTRPQPGTSLKGEHHFTLVISDGACFFFEGGIESNKSKQKEAEETRRESKSHARA